MKQSETELGRYLRSAAKGDTTMTAATAGVGRDEHFTPAEALAKVGKRIRTTIAFSGVPQGTTGTILDPDDELMTLPIQWDLPGRARPLVDWFSKWEYEKYLEEIADD
jgi:hypothetical protein